MNNKLQRLAVKFAQFLTKEDKKKAQIEMLYNFSLELDAKLKLTYEELMGDLLELKESWIKYPKELQKVIKDISANVTYFQGAIESFDPYRAANMLVDYVEQKSTKALIENFEFITKELAKKNKWDENRFRGMKNLIETAIFAKKFMNSHPIISYSLIPEGFEEPIIKEVSVPLTKEQREMETVRPPKP